MVLRKKETTGINIEALDALYYEHLAEKELDTTEVMAHMLIAYTFRILGNDDQSPLGMYQGDLEGTYTTNEDKIEAIIMQQAPSLSAVKIREVYQKIKWQAAMNLKVELTHDKNLIPVENGVFDIKTKTLLPFDKKYIFTSKVMTPFNPDAKEPTIGEDKWTPSKWIMELANGDKDVYTLFWQVIHAAANGSFSYRKSIWLFGNGNDGKGTFQKLIMSVVGAKNVASLKANEFSQRFALSAMEGKTCVIGDDVPANVFLDDSSNFNSVVTGDPVMIEKKNRQPYSAILTVTVIQSTNEMPKFKNNSNGTMRRLLIVPFTKEFSGDNDNWKIKDDYVTRPEVCEWVLKNALLNYDFDKFIEPEVTKQQLEEFKQDNNPLSNFKEEVFDKYNPDVIPTDALFKYYVAYQKETGQRNIMSAKRFTTQFSKLVAASYEKKHKRIKNNDWAFDGLFPNNSTVQDMKDYSGTNVQAYVRRIVPTTN